MDCFGCNQALLMDNLMDEEDHSFYWETRRIIENEELDNYSMSMGLDEAIPGYYYTSSSPETGMVSSSFPNGAGGGLPKSIVMERKRRQLVNERLYALRGVVPNITKMDKASIIKDAIDYIQLLQEQERRMRAEISELETFMAKERVVLPSCDEDAAEVLNFERRKKKLKAKSSLLVKSPLEVIKLQACQAGEKTMLVSISCSKNKGSMNKICELFETLNLKVTTACITSVSTGLLHTMLVESNEMSSTHIKEMMEGAIAELNAQSSRVT